MILAIELLGTKKQNFGIRFRERRMVMAVAQTLCARCAGQGKTCCQGREIYITPGDLMRIRNHIGGVGFAEWTGAADPAYLDQDDDPVWRLHVFAGDGSRRTLRRNAEGDCIFLTPTGCQLSLDIRPLLCRLHPFTYTAGGIDPEPDAGCPRHLLTAGESVFTAIDMSIELANLWHRQLYEEIRKETPDQRSDE